MQFLALLFVSGQLAFAAPALADACVDVPVLDEQPIVDVHELSRTASLVDGLGAMEFPLPGDSRDDRGAVEECWSLLVTPGESYAHA